MRALRLLDLGSEHFLNPETREFLDRASVLPAGLRDRDLREDLEQAERLLGA